MKIAWITRSFLDYRVPVYQQLSELIGGKLTLFYYGEVVPDRVAAKARSVLGENAVPLKGEWRLIGQKVQGGGFANSGLRIPFQPGLVRAVRRLQPEVIVSDGFFQWTYAALWLRALGRIPHVMCYERAAHNERKAQWYRIAYRKLVLRWIDAICCTGRLCGEYVQSLGFPHDRITYGHMVADVDGLQEAVSGILGSQATTVARRHDLKGLVFLYVGRLIALKGIDKLLRAWKTFSSGMGGESSTLLIVGDGPERGELEQYCQHHALNNVRFAGEIDYEALTPYYKAADAFVIPTLEDNWSLVVPEAMACGLPILCSKYNGCWPEYVTPANGWVFDPLDVNDTSRCLSQCFSKCRELPEMGRRSSEIIDNYRPLQAAEAILRACDIAVRHRDGS